jgi:hypothetical protein
MAEKKKVITNQAAIEAARRAETERPAKLAEQQAKLPVVKEALATAQVGARGTTGQTIFEKALAGIPAGGDTGAARGLAAMSARYGLQAAAANAYTDENIGYNISEQTKAEQGAVTSTENLITQYGTPVNVPNPIYDEEETDTAGKTSAYDLLNEFKLLGLDSLLEDVKRLIIDGVGDDQLLLEIRKTPAWQKRFAANKTRLARGIRALSEGEYIDLETKYQDIMRNYGLPASYYSKTATGTNESFEKLIGGNVSPVKLEEKIMIGTNRVLNASPFVTTALKEFFPEITNGDILAYVLDPDRGLDEINRKVTAAEIGGAFLGTKTTSGASLTTSLGRAEELARAGVTGTTAKQAATAIGGGLERGRQLTSFYQQSPYTQELAEQELLNLPGQTEAREKRRKVIELDKSEFNKKTGYTSGAISLDRAGSY